MPEMTGEQYRAIRLKLKWTQQQVAEALDMTANTIARRERDELPISREAELAMRYLGAKRNKWQKG